MNHSLKQALRQLVRREAGMRTRLRAGDDAGALHNASTVEGHSVRGESEGLPFIIGDPQYGTLADDAPWVELG